MADALTRVAESMTALAQQQAETNALLRQLAERPIVVEMPVPSPVASPVASATDMQQGEKKVRERVVDAAKAPRDYINAYLDAHPESVARLAEPDYGYRELADEIGQHYGMDFDHTTVYRVVKKRKG